jgi:hypothetical protein
MPALNWIVLILCVHIPSASVLPTTLTHSAHLSLSTALMLRDELHRRLNPEHRSTPLVPETTASNGSPIDRGNDGYEEFTHSYSVRRWRVGLACRPMRLSICALPLIFS